MQIKLIIPGEPKGKARPRMSTKTGIAYTPKKTMEYENWVRQCYVLSGNKKQLEGQIRAEINCYYSIPKSVSKKKKQEMIDGKVRPIKKPDIDNVCKAILDSLNTIAYKDDSQVVECIVRKWYGEEPRVEFILEEV